MTAARARRGPAFWVAGSLLFAGATICLAEDPVRLEVSTARSLIRVGDTTQLRVIGHFADGRTQDLTAATTGTRYVSSGLQDPVTTVGTEGLVTGVRAGRNLVMVANGETVASILITASNSPDADGDGMPDDFEQANGLDPADPSDATADADGDGLSNREEFVFGTDPRNADTDGDGARDGDELGRAHDPRDPDMDGDGLLDGDEITRGTDPKKRDTDRDGIPDGVEVANGSDPRDAGSPPPPPKLDESCTATILNRLTQVSPDGTFVLANVPSTDGPFRARVICEEPAGIFRAQSAFAVPVPGGNTFLRDIRFSDDDPIPVALTLSAPTAVLTAAAPTVQLVATGTRPDGDEFDLTAGDTGTTYTSSNPQIATVTRDGLVTAAASGPVFVTAVHEGVVGGIRLDVRFSNDSDGDGLPDDFERQNATNPGGANLARLPGTRVVASSFLGSFAPERVIDGSLLTSWFTGLEDAVNQRSTPFIEVILPVDALVARVRLLGNRQNPRASQFLAGIVQVFDAAGNEVFSSGNVLLAAPGRDVTITVNRDGVRRVRFTPTADQTDTPALGEIEILSGPGGRGLDPTDPSDAALDFDGDGLSNLEEFGLGTSVFVNDTDGDGLTDSQERSLGSNPRVADTDGDGLPDGSEVDPLSDTDRDGLANLFDPDSDNDGLPDGVEVRLGLDPLLLDSDRNGRPDGNEDSDGDGLANIEEVRERTDPANPDTDGDGLRDGEEVVFGNDGRITDPLRADTDGDGMPDGYESLFRLNPNDPSDAAGDPDGDGLTNLEESRRGTDPFSSDNTPPTVTQVIPADGAVGAGTNVSVVIAFDERLQPSSLTAATARLSEGETLVIRSVALTGDNRAVAITPAQPLRAQTLYGVHVEGIRDQSGNLMVGAFESRFTTGAFVDTVAPTIVRTSPTANFLGVPVNSPVTVEFSEPIDPASVTTSSFLVRDLGLNLAGTVRVDPDGRTASFVPTLPFSVGRQHTVLLTNSIRDVVGNRLAVQTFTFLFTTGFSEDHERPRLVTASPADGMTRVPINARVILDFSEPIQAIGAARAIQLRLGATPVAGSIALVDGNRRARFTPAAPLLANTTYSVEVTTALTDTAGNALNDPFESTFTTRDTGEALAVVTEVDPPDGATGIATNVVVRIQFSEPIDPRTVTPRSLFLGRAFDDAAPFLPGVVEVSSDGLSATLTYPAPLMPGTQYTVKTADFLLADLGGQALGPGTTARGTFMTADDQDAESPRVVQVSPLDGTTAVPVNARVVVRLSEPASAPTVGSQSLRLTAGGTGVAGTVSTSTDGLSLTFTPSRPLSTGTSHTVTLSGITDRAGHTVVPFASGFVTAASSEPDTQRPSVLSVIPADGAVEVDGGAPIVLTFDERIDPGTASQASVSVTVDGFSGVVAGSYSVSGGRVTFAPAAPLPGNAHLRVAVSLDGLRDLAGNGSSSFQSAFTTGGGADVTPPRVVMVSPTDGATGIGPSTRVVLTFSESLNPATVDENTFGVFAAGQQLFASLSRSADNRTITLSTFLPRFTAATVLVTSGVQDLSGNHLADFVSRFITGDGFEERLPGIVSQRPANGAVDVPRDASLTLYVDEPLDEETVPGAFHLAANGQLVAGRLTVSGNGRTVLFVPAAPLPPAALMEVFMDTSALDLQGHPLVNYQASFQTVADPSGRPPTVVRTSPTPFTSGVPLNVHIEAEYSEPLDPATVNTGTVILRQSIVGQPVVPSTVSLERGGRVVRIVPNAPLLPNASYSYDLTSGIRDLSGQGSTLSRPFFSTGPATDTTRPGILALSPPDGSSGVPPNAVVRVRFDEAVNPISVSEATVRLTTAGGSRASSTISFTNGDREVVLAPYRPLEGSAAYEVAVEGVVDLAGNDVAPRAVQFTTGIEPDTRRPVVVRTAPTDEGAGVPVNAPIAVQLDEAIDPGTANSSGLVVEDNVSGPVAGTYSVSADRRMVTFVPAAPLAPGRLHAVRAFGLLDLAGNAAFGPTTFSFTTSSNADTTAPEVRETNPGDGQAQVPTNTQVMIGFNEAIESTSIDGVTLSRDGVEQPVNRSVISLGFGFSSASRIVALATLAPLDRLTTYTVVVAGVRDSAGNPMAAPRTITFTTGAGAELGRPAVIGADPPNGATGVPTDTVAGLQFSQRMSPLTLTPDTFFLQTADGRRTPCDVRLSADGRSATCSVPGGLAPATGYSAKTIDFLIRNAVGLTLFTGNSSTTWTTFTTAPLPVSPVTPTTLLAETANVPSADRKRRPAPDDSADRSTSEVAWTWFERLYDVVKAERTAPPLASRAYGLAAVALYQAVVDGSPGHRSLVGQLNGLTWAPRAEGRIHWPAAANTALAETIRGLFPALTPASRASVDELEEGLRRHLSAEASPDTLERSIAHGRAVAEAILGWAATDGLATYDNCPYLPAAVAGGWKPTRPAFTLDPLQPCWGQIRPMVLASGGECAPAGPPAFSTSSDSEFYAAAREVYDVGRHLTPEQKTISDYWSDNAGATGTPPGHWIAVVSQLARHRKLSLAEATEAYARVGLAVHDAFIAGWHVKYVHDLERPATFINDVIDPAWRPYAVTPSFPSYISGHAVQSAAAAAVLTAMFGPASFTDTTHRDHGLTPPQAPRSFSSFDEAAAEAALSRLYGGIHYRFDNEDGLASGQCIGQAVLDRVRFEQKPGGSR